MKMKIPKKNIATYLGFENGEWILVKNGIEFPLDIVGKDIWDQCNGRRNYSEITDRLLEKYKGNREEILLDVVEFIDELEALGLIKYVD